MRKIQLFGGTPELRTFLHDFLKFRGYDMEAVNLASLSEESGPALALVDLPESFTAAEVRLVMRCLDGRAASAPPAVLLAAPSHAGFFKESELEERVVMKPLSMTELIEKTRRLLDRLPALAVR